MIVHPVLLAGALAGAVAWLVHELRERTAALSARGEHWRAS
jgi:hypothetical protein